MVLESTRLRIVDPDVPGVEALVSEVPPPLAAALAEAGSRLERAVPVQITWWPGQELTVRYNMEASGGGWAGPRQAVAVAGRVPDGAMVVANGDASVGVWIVPNDPALPGLRSAMDTAAVSSLLQRLGADTEISRLRLRAYRPTRRAVVEVATAHRSLYLKVVRPDQAEKLHLNHRHLASHIPAPDSLGLDAGGGIVVLPALPGHDLRHALRTGGPPPPASEVAGLLEALPAPAHDRPARSSIEAARRLAELLKRIVPDEHGRLERLLDAIGDETVPATAPVHGDFHEAQLMTDEGRLTGVLDVDTYGWGRPGDDPATMLAHLHLLATGSARPQPTLEYAGSLQRIWDASVEPSDLRRRVAAVAMALATGPFRVQRPNWPSDVSRRLEVAERWVESAARVDERSLIAISGRSHSAAGR